MPTSQHHVIRTDILELKSHIEKKIGRAETESYLNLLSKFLSLKISKSDFDKLIIAKVKKENISLHNALLRGIIKNVCLSKTPQLIKNNVEEEVKKEKQLNRIFQGGLSFKSLCKDLPIPPRKERTHRRFRDCNGSNGKNQVTEVVSTNGKPQCSMEDGEEVDQLIRSWRSQPIEAPLGVNLRDVVKKKHHNIGTCYSSGQLPDSVSLKKKLEDELGLEVSFGFANSLNAGLDVFLKRLINSRLELAASRSNSGGEVCSSVGTASNSLLTSSLLNFQVAMELNPSILGVNWPAKLEKIRLLTPDLPADSQTS